LFLDYAPVSLTFGTSGLRGLVKDITDLEAYINVKAALRYFSGIGDIRAPGMVLLAGDLRPSTDRIMRACAQAIVDAGHQVQNAGNIPTPALISHAIATGRAGVMVSGSHIPFDRNGIKLNKSAGEVLKSDEPGITREIERVRAEEYDRAEADSLFDRSGMLKRSPILPQLDRAAEESYVRRYRESFSRGGLSGLRVLVYQHSAVGRDTLPRILSELGADVVTAGRSETFVPIDGMAHVFDRSGAAAMPMLLNEPAAIKWQRCKATLAGFFKPALGFDDIVRINVLDGVRVHFRNGDIAHVRPSGNAPQLRIYANGCRSPSRSVRRFQRSWWRRRMGSSDDSEQQEDRSKLDV
jgi:phosphomannomutase